MAGKYDIYVYEEGDVFYVTPPVAVVERNHRKVKVRNLTERDLTLVFAPGVIVKNEIPVKKKTRAAGTGEGEIDAAADGIYDYQVHVRLTSKISTRALANSWPKIIVDP